MLGHGWWQHFWHISPITFLLNLRRQSHFCFSLAPLISCSMTSMDPYTSFTSPSVSYSSTCIWKTFYPSIHMADHHGSTLLSSKTLRFSGRVRYETWKEPGSGSPESTADTYKYPWESLKKDLQRRRCLNYILRTEGLKFCLLKNWLITHWQHSLLHMGDWIWKIKTLNIDICSHHSTQIPSCPHREAVLGPQIEPPSGEHLCPPLTWPFFPGGGSSKMLHHRLLFIPFTQSAFISTFEKN